MKIPKEEFLFKMSYEHSYHLFDDIDLNQIYKAKFNDIAYLITKENSNEEAQLSLPSECVQNFINEGRWIEEE